MIKRAFVVLSILSLLLSCSSDDVQRNPFLSDPAFSFEINLNLPLYDDLRFAGGSQYIPQGGIRGFFVFNLTGTDYFAWEATCPNHIPNNCSTMTITGVTCSCSCENYEYSLATGQILTQSEDGESLYSMQNYRVRANGNTLVISN